MQIYMCTCLKFFLHVAGAVSMRKIWTSNIVCIVLIISYVVNKIVLYKWLNERKQDGENKQVCLDQADEGEK